MERELIADYEAGLKRLVADISKERLSLAVRIASVPNDIRGYGYIKEGSMKTAKAAEAALWNSWKPA